MSLMLNDAASQVCLQQFRNRISDIKMDDFEKHDVRVMSWLIARDFDLDKAEEMIRAFYDWRAESNFDKLLEWKSPSNYSNSLPYELTGYDNDGSPIVIIPICEWDRFVRDELNVGGKNDLHRYVDQMTAKVYSGLKSVSKPSEDKMVSEYVMIIDLSGFSLGHLTSVSIPEVLFESLRRLERNFPETMKLAYLINAPKVFAMLFPLIKQILPTRTSQKLRVFDSNSDNWKSALLKDIPAQQLPLNYGGTLPDTLQDKLRLVKEHRAKYI